MYYYLLHDKKDLIQIYFKDKLVGKTFDLFYEGLKPIQKLLSSNIYLLDEEKQEFLIFDIVSDYCIFDLKEMYKLFKNVGNYRLSHDIPKVQLLVINIDAKKDDKSLKEAENFLYMTRGKEILLLETDLSKEVETAKSKIQNNENLEDKDLFSLIFYPLTFENDDKDNKINQVIDIIKEMNNDIRTFIIAGLMLLCRTFYTDDTFERLAEYIHMDEEFLEYRREYYRQVALDEDEYDEDLLQKMIIHQHRTPYDINKYYKPNFISLSD